MHQVTILLQTRLAHKTLILKPITNSVYNQSMTLLPTFNHYETNTWQKHTEFSLNLHYYKISLYVMCSCSSIVEKGKKNDSIYTDLIHGQHWQMILLVHLKILRSTMCKIPDFQNLAESISRIQGQKKNQGPFPGPKPKFKGFSRIPGSPGPLATLSKDFIWILLNVNLSMNQTLLAFLLYVRQTWMIQLILPISVKGYLNLIWKDSVTDMHGLAVYVKEGLLFAQNLTLDNSVDSYFI